MKKRRFAANTVGAVGYLLIVLGWLWASILVLTNTGILDNLESEPQAASHSVPRLPEFTLPEPVTVIFLVIIVTLMIVATIYAIFKTPVEAVRQSSRVARTTAIKITPQKSHKTNKPIPAKERKLITARLTFYIKLALTLIPLLVVGGLTIFTHSELSLDPHLAVMISGVISILAILLFAAQYLIAYIFKLPLERLL